MLSAIVSVIAVMTAFFILLWQARRIAVVTKQAIGTENNPTTLTLYRKVFMRILDMITLAIFIWFIAVVIIPDKSDATLRLVHSVVFFAGTGVILIPSLRMLTWGITGEIKLLSNFLSFNEQMARDPDFHERFQAMQQLTLAAFRRGLFLFAFGMVALVINFDMALKTLGHTKMALLIALPAFLYGQFVIEHFIESARRIFPLPKAMS